MSTDSDDQSWRRHEVPTYTQAEDTWLLGLSLKQLLGIGIMAAIAYALYQFSPLAFFPQTVRIAIAGIFAVAGAGFIIIRPDGRSMFSIIKDLLSFFFASKEYIDSMDIIVSPEPQESIDARLSEGQQFRKGSSEDEGWRRFIPNISFLKGGNRNDGTGTALICLALLGASGLVSVACGSGQISAQGIPEPYVGRRAYLQSVVVDFRDNGRIGGNSANIRIKSAASLKSLEPRVNQTLQSVTERKSHDTRVFAARRMVSGVGGEAGGRIEDPIIPVMGVEVETELAFNDIYIGPAAGRPYCDVRLREKTLLADGVPEIKKYAGHVYSGDCRIRQPGGGGTNVDIEEGLSKPYVTVNWVDRVQNTGALNIDRALLPYPRPWMTEVDPIIDHGANGEIVVNPFDLCNIDNVKFLSLGIQTEKPLTEETYNYFGSLREFATKPPGYSQTDGYFDGEEGRRIAGQIQTCHLNRNQKPISVILSDTEILDGDDISVFDIVVRPMVTTKDPDNNVVNTARLVIKDAFAGNVIETMDIPKFGQPNFFGEHLGAQLPTVRFNIDASSLHPFDNHPNKVKLKFSVEFTHMITVERPVYQPVDFYPRLVVSHIQSCGSCSSSGGGGSCSCSRTPNINRAYEYYPDHYRVDSRNQRYLPNTSDAQVTITVKQTVNFEERIFQFDQPYEELVYVRPTPEPGELREQEYMDVGDILGLWGRRGHIICGPELNNKDPYTGWIYIPPSTNSKGESYGNQCRRDFQCCIQIPKVEEACNDPPTEEEWECPYRLE